MFFFASFLHAGCAVSFCYEKAYDQYMSGNRFHPLLESFFLLADIYFAPTHFCTTCSRYPTLGESNPIHGCCRVSDMRLQARLRVLMRLRYFHAAITKLNATTRLVWQTPACAQSLQTSVPIITGSACPAQNLVG